MNEKIVNVNILKKIGVIFLLISIMLFIISLFCILVLHQLGIVVTIFWIAFGVFIALTIGVSIVRGVIEIKQKYQKDK